MTPGIHLLHKPAGLTSFALLQSLATRTTRRSCHGGALDPFSTGLLLVLVEPATRLFDYLHAVPKVYHATVRWGEETDNGDPTGNIISRGDASALTPQRLDEALAQFVGWHDQIPPSTSNKRVDGERAYLRVHRGETVDLPPSRVYLHEARWTSHDLPHCSRLTLSVAGGYYVRSLARDLGRVLQCGAHLAQLHREAIGPWTDPGLGNGVAVTGRDVLPWASSRTLADAEVGLLKQGKTIPLATLEAPEWQVPTGFPAPSVPVRGFHRERFSFLLTTEADQLRLLRPLRGGL